MDNESDKYFLFSTIFGILLTISEILPYIKNIKSNGVLEFILETCFLLLKKRKLYDRTVENDASERLLENVIGTFDTIDTRNENVRNENVRNENVINENVRNENVRNENVKNENVKNENVKKCLTITFVDRLRGTSENITITFNSPKEIKIS